MTDGRRPLKRREFSKVTAALALGAGTGCGGGSSSDAPAGTPVSVAAQPVPPELAVQPVKAVPEPEAAAPPPPGAPPMGTNLSGMEWAVAGLRFSPSSRPNVDFTVPRAADVAYLASTGHRKNRLPIQWELLQPMLHDTPANAAARAAIGQPGQFHAAYASCITGVLDAHAAVGSRCIIDLHNYCRYQDFRFQPDGSVIGLTVPSDPLVRAYTRDASQVRTRIFALAPGATLTVANFTDFWTRAALKWKDHPGFGGYGLMNEPYDLPRDGGIVAWNEEPQVRDDESLLIWPEFAKAAIAAIRALDATGTIYLSGNKYGGALSIPFLNPAWPLAPDNQLVYEVHNYMDAINNGRGFDFDLEVARNFTIGVGNVPISLDTGLNRMKIATEWAQAKRVRLALTEVGMPIDDVRWEEAFRRTVAHAFQAGCEVQSWVGGNHWTVHNTALNHVPGWHQNKTLEPAVSGVMKQLAGIAQATLFDDGPGHAPAGSAITITVYARGHLPRPVNLTVTSSNGGSLSKSVLTIPAGANGQDSYTYTSAANRVATLRYVSDGQFGGQVPPPRRVYSLNDPVAYAASSLSDAAMAIIARYGACKWDLADGYTDYLLGRPAAEGQEVRAVSDSGYGSSPGNAMEMKNWTYLEDGNPGALAVPVMRLVNGRKSADFSAPRTFGLWCKKSVPTANQPRPRNRVPYDLHEPHFAIAAVSVPRLGSTGAVFQASRAEEFHACELGFADGLPQARWQDAAGQAVRLTSAARLPTGTPSVVSLTSAPGAQSLRVNSAAVASASATLAPSVCNQMLIGWSYLGYNSRESFNGQVHGVITGRGVPSAAELAVLERYLGAQAGMA
jgi:endoglucanase